MNSRRDNFCATLKHQKPDRMLIDLGGNPLSSMEGDSERHMLEFLGFTQEKRQPLLFGDIEPLDERILKHFDIDTRFVGEILKPQESQFHKLSETEYIDEWGIARRYTGLYWEQISTPLKGASIQELKDYQFPNPDSIDMAVLKKHAERAKKLYNETDYVICASHPVYGIFELGCWLCGFEDFLYRMAMEPEFIHCMFERILDYQKRVIKIYYRELGEYIHYTSSGDDFATQNGPFFSPDMFSEFITPYFKERIAYTKLCTKAAYLHHSCGSVYSLMDSLIDCGVEILNPIQPKARNMDLMQLKNNFGAKIVFHGGIDTQELLPFASQQEIEEKVAETIEIMGKNGGYIFAAAHNIQPDVNPKSLAIMLEAANKVRKQA